MNNIFPITLSLTLVTMSLSALAHDPRLHQPKDAAPVDCSSMKDLDPSKMDLRDPLMKALYDKCKGTLMPGHVTDQNRSGSDQTIEQSADHGGK